jgi:1-deoxy-D-xylulose-5-phosphate synthase
MIRAEPRRASRTVWVGGVRLGGGAPVAIEAVLEPPAGRDRAALAALRAEAERLERAGADLLRLACASAADIEALALIAPSCATPLLADIGGGDPRLALAAVEAGARGVWLSPQAQDDAALAELAALALSHGCALGVRLGPPSPVAVAVAPSPPIALAERALRAAEHLAAQGCADIVVAMRLDDPLATMAAMRALGRACDWPLALAPGAARPGSAGAAAAMAIGLPLAQGFGDLVRLPRSADPVAETRAAVQALRTLRLRPRGVEFVAEEGFLRLRPDAPEILSGLEERLAHLQATTVVATLSARAAAAPDGPSRAAAPRDGPGPDPALRLLVACGGPGARAPDLAERIARLIEDRVATARARDLHGLAAALDRGTGAPAARAWIEAAVALFALERGRSPPVVWGAAVGEAAWMRLTGRRPAWQAAHARVAAAQPGEDRMLAACALSTAVGLALAARRAGRPAEVVAVVDTAALGQAAGLAAIRTARDAGIRLLVVLLDPDLDEAGLPGEVAAQLSRVVSSGPYLAMRDLGKRIASGLPGPGYVLARRAEEFARGIAAGGFMFDELGVYHVGPVSGRRYDQLLPVLRNLRDARRAGPVLLHVAAAARAVRAPAVPPCTGVLAGELARVLAADPRRVLIARSDGPPAAALADLARRHPGQVLDGGEAVHHAIGLARGLAAGGAWPLLLFDRRRFWPEAGEALRNWLRLGLPATVLVDLAAGASDLAWLDAPPLELAVMPGVAVLHAASPGDFAGLVEAAGGRPEPLSLVAFADGPAVAAAAGSADGTPRTLRHGTDVAILALGRGVGPACTAADRLATLGIGTTVVDAVVAQPLDASLVRRLAATHRMLVVVDDPPVAARIAPAARAALDAGAAARLHVVTFGRRTAAEIVAAAGAARP